MTDKMKTDARIIHEDLDNEYWVVTVSVEHNDETYIIEVQANTDTLICRDTEYPLIPFKTYGWPKTGLVIASCTIVALQYIEHNVTNIQEKAWFKKD